MIAKEIYELWLRKLPEGNPLRDELLAIRDDENEINERFYQEIVFGTAGLRGICGAGTNRMNELTVGRATQGIANYIIKSGEDISRGVVIAYDCRYHSKEFSELAAQILAGNGIKAYIFPSLRPTPELSFAIRRLNTVSGINMTASHNPKEYNGYKVYWSDGAQISGEVSSGMLKEIQALDMFDEFKCVSMEDGVKSGLIEILDDTVDNDYMDYVIGMTQRPDDQLDLDVPVVYTPLNGAGSIPMEVMAKRRGFKNFVIVPEHKDPDPDFTTVPFPNPENPKAFELAEKLGRELGAEVLIATDPDSDRMAVEIADGKGGYISLNGNQTGAMIINYMAESMTENGTMPKNPMMIKSIVTGDLGRKICEDYGITVYEALTGFKNICGRIPELEAKGHSYFFAYEESIGCAPGEAVRDKDGVTAGMLVTEMAAYYRKKGTTIIDGLEELYKKYGYFAEEQVSIVLQGQAGQARIGRIMTAFRDGKPQSFGEFGVKKTIDYINGYEDIPAENVLIYKLDDDETWFAMRPSGTEPKIKFYYYTKTDSREKSLAKIASLKDAVGALIDSVE